MTKAEEDKLDKMFRYMEKRFEAVDKRFDAVDQKINNIQDTLDFLVGEYSRLSDELSANIYNTSRVIDQVADLDARVYKLELAPKGA
jgi:archaellum component FlaC